MLFFISFDLKLRENMKLPRKITPDNLTNSVVQINFVSDYPFEVLIGMLYSSLEKTYELENSENNQEEGIVKISFVKSFKHKDLPIRIKLNPSNIVFNHIGNYPGWKIFEKEILDTIEILSRKILLTPAKQIGIRYISEFPNNDIFEIIKLNEKNEFKFDGFKKNLLKFEYLKEKKRINLTCYNRLDNKVSTSIFDIDVITYYDTEIGNLKEILNDNHLVQKEVFFSILTEKFLKSLNPEY